MKNTFQNLLLFAFLIATTAAHATHAVPVATAKASPEVITFLKVTAAAGNSADVQWLSSIDAPYTITVEDMNTNLIVFSATSFNNSINVPSLVAGVKYLVTVNDSQGFLNQVFSF